MEKIKNGNMLRAFFLLWVGLVYIWGLQIGQTCSGDATCFRRPGIVWSFASDTFHWNDLLTPLNAVFTICIVLHSCLYWIMLSRKRSGRFYLVSFMLQGGVMLGIGLVKPNGYVLLSLCLGLILQAIAVLQQPRPIAFAIAEIGSFFVLSMQVARAWNSFEKITDYSALFVFVALYAFLYIQQIQDHKQDKELHRELQIAHTQMAAYAAQVEDLTLITERQRLARELHDTLAQGLTGVIMQMQAITPYLTKDELPRARMIMEQAIACARETLADARCAIDDLRCRISGAADLPGAVQEEIVRFTAITDIKCKTDLTLLATLPPYLCEHVLRMISEGLSNIARHARAHRVWVRVLRRDEAFLVEVQDDGVGFDSETALMRTGHYGLLGLQERANLLGGHLDVVSVPGQGLCCVCICAVTRKRVVAKEIL